MSAAVETASRPSKGGWPRSAVALQELAFELPPELEASVPPEARGIARDGVRLMVSDHNGDKIRHTTFRNLADFLCPGDLLVVNTSATLNAALAATWKTGSRAGQHLDVHLSTPLPGGYADEWVVELRAPADAGGSSPIFNAQPGDCLLLAGDGLAMLLQPYPQRQDGDHLPSTPVRLWTAQLSCPGGVLHHTATFGRPIQYRYVNGHWPLDVYQTVFADTPGSAEMPSAGRPFTGEVLTRIENAGVRVAPLVLHTGVSSLEANELPYPERHSVPHETAAAVNSTRQVGGRVIAVGTTVIRALETVGQRDGTVQAGEGWTDLVISPASGIQTVDGMLAGLHEPRSSHLSMLEALVGRHHLEETYRAALEERYLWHEFGDVHLMFKDRD